MNIDGICDAIINSCKSMLTTHIKSELEKIKIRDLKELGADSHYNYIAVLADISMDTTDNMLSHKPADIHVIFRMQTSRYSDIKSGRKKIKTRLSQSIWYITDRGMTIEKYTSYVHDTKFLEFIRYNHTLSDDNVKGLHIKSNKTDNMGTWNYIATINNSMPPLPKYWYNIFANDILAKLCSLFNPYNIDVSIDMIPVYLAELAQKAAKSPHINELLLSNSVTQENVQVLALINEKKAELDKYHAEIVKERAELDAELEKFRKFKKEC